MDHFLCGGTCARSIGESDIIITCNGPCQRQFHAECAGFHYAEQLFHGLWFCNPCQQELPLPRSTMLQFVQELCRNGEAEQQEMMKEKNTVVELPGEMLEMIFRYLNYRQLGLVRRTCKRWKDVVDGSIALTRKFCLQFPRDIMMDRDYDPVCLPPAAAVKIWRARIVTIDPWWSLLSSKLVEINLNDCIMSLPALANMLRLTPNLKQIDLDTLYCPQVYDVATMANFQMHQMEVIELTDCVPSVDALLGSVCTRVKKYHSMYTQRNGDSLDPDSNKKLKYIEKWQNTLESLLVTPSESMLSAISSLKNLRLTALSMVCNFIGAGHIISLLKQMQHLKRLELVGIMVPYSVLQDIGQTLPELSFLVVEINLEVVWNMSFLNTMPNLEQFRVVSQEPTNTSTDSTMANFHGTYCRKLQELELYGLYPSDWAEFREFIKAAPELHSISLEAIGIDEWSTIFEALPMTKLRSLSLTSINNIYNVRNDSLVEYYENLRCLKLENVTMGVQTLRVLFRLCPQLEVVSLCHIASLDDVSVLVLCQKLKRLADLTIDACPITDSSIGHIIENCKALERLDIQRCPGLTSAAHDQVVASWLNEIMGRVRINKIYLAAQG